MCLVNTLKKTVNYDTIKTKVLPKSFLGLKEEDTFFIKKNNIEFLMFFSITRNYWQITPAPSLILQSWESE
jgi:hypothetical protein